MNWFRRKPAEAEILAEILPGFQIGPRLGARGVVFPFELQYEGVTAGLATSPEDAIRQARAGSDNLRKVRAFNRIHDGADAVSARKEARS